MNNYLFVSDIHGRDTNLETDLINIANSNSVPKIVFFLGDIIGTTKLDQLQKLFYNGVVNYAKQILPETSDEKILNYPTANGETLSDGIQNIWNFLYEPRELGNKFKADYIRELATYAHFGHFCSNLPEPVRKNLQEEMKENAKVWIDIMTKFTNQGSLVVVVEGNWDARTPLDFFPIKDECKPIPTEERSFYFKDFLKSTNDQILYFDQAGTIETEDEIFVIWPFDCATNATIIPEFEERETRKIILVSHTQIDWTSIKGNTPMTGEGRKIQESMGMTFTNLHANTAVHGHLHDTISTDGYFFKEKFIHYLPKGTCRYIDF